MTVYDVSEIATDTTNVVKISKPTDVPHQSWGYRKASPNEQRGEQIITELVTLGGTDLMDISETKYDQFEIVAQELAKCYFSRRQQIVLWKVEEDTKISDPPCLQSLWFRILPDEKGVWRLNMNIRMRSRDAYRAAFMNAYAFINFMKKMADRISEITERRVELGRYMDMSDSYHIYGSTLEDFRDRFLNIVAKRPFEDRTWTMEDVQPMIDEGLPQLLENIKKFDKEHGL